MAHWPRDRVDLVALSPQAVHNARLRDGSPTFGTIAPRRSRARLVETDLLIPPSRSTEGRIAIVTDAGWDAVDARSVCSLPRKGEGIETRRGCLKFESVNELSERFRSGLVRPSRSLFSSAVSGLSADAARPWRLAPATVP